MLLDDHHFVLLHGVIGGLDDSLLSIAALALGFAVLCFVGYGLMSRTENQEAQSESERNTD
jgi:hypothetical protein